MYPKLILDYEKLVHNTKELVNKAGEKNISIMGVSKSFCALDEGVKAFVEGGVDFIADSRIENLAKINCSVPKVLLRLPIKSQIEDVIKFSDISLNSSLETIKLLNDEAMKQNVCHKIILMFDIGDLREGIYYTDNYLAIVEEVLKLNNIELFGIGTNLTCFGGVIPTKSTLDKLETIGKNIESTFNVDLQVKSFGNSSSIYLLDNDEDYSYFNNLRLGESLVLGFETAYGNRIDNTFDDVFTFEAQVIEAYNKPSKPDGEIGVNAFGEKVTFEDRGNINRLILGFGRQDVNYENLEPITDGIELLGGSSDHTIIEDVTGNLKVGDVVRFKLSYGALLSLSTSPYIKKETKNGK